MIKETIHLFEWVLREKGLSAVISGLGADSPKPRRADLPEMSNDIETEAEDPYAEPKSDQDLWLDDILGFDFTETLGLPNEWSI